jgi:hypothetical protein
VISFPDEVRPVSDPEKPKVYVSAFVCTETIRDKESDLLTAINITNGFNAGVSVLTPKHPDGSLVKEKRIIFCNPINCHAVIAFYAERETDVEFLVKARRPDGSEMGTARTPQIIEIGEGAAGMVLNVKLSLASEMEGTHWIELYTDGELATKLPIKVVHETPSEDPNDYRPPVGASR